MNNSLFYRALIKSSILFSFILLMHIPCPIQGCALLPDVPLLYVIYANLSFCSSWFLFFSLICGVINDLIAGNVIGNTAMEFAIVYVMLGCNTRFILKKSFYVIWSFIAGIIILCELTNLLLDYFILSSLFLNWKVVYGSLMTAASYPIAHLIFKKAGQFLRKRNA